MKMLLTPLKLGKITLKNRIVLPPIATFGWGAEDGSVTPVQLEHYRRMAAGGAGMVTVEASCVSEGADCGRNAIALWDDRFQGGLEELARVIRAGGARAGIQLYHPGREPLSAEGFRSASKDFSRAAKLVRQAGFECVELHAAHGFLLDSMCANGLETDVFALAEEVKGACGDMALGVRLGVSSPDADAAVLRAGAFIHAGADYISVSSGVGRFERPQGGEWPYSALMYGASLVKPHIDKPVFGVWGIREHAQAEAILEAGIADAVCVGRAMLCDPEWARKAASGEKLNCCRECAHCMWHKDGRRCPAQKFLPEGLSAASMDIQAHNKA